MTDTTSTPLSESPEIPANPYQPDAAAPQPTPAPATANGFSVASLVLGAVSIPSGLAVAGIVAVVLGFVARGREPQHRTLSTWGIVFGFVGVFGWAIVAILGIAVAAPFALWGLSLGWGPDLFDWF